MALFDVLHQLVDRVPWRDEAEKLLAHESVRLAAVESTGKPAENAPAPIDPNASGLTASPPSQDVASLIEEAVNRRLGELQQQDSAPAGRAKGSS
jgi:hypothetical protein